MKRTIRLANMVALIALAIAAVVIARELHRLNTNIENIRSEIPMSLLGN